MIFVAKPDNSPGTHTMPASSLFRRLMTRALRDRPASPIRRPRPVGRPLEALEDRVTPTTGVFTNVPEASAYSLVYELQIPTTASFRDGTPVPYSVNNAAALTNNFDRIAYYLELDTGTGSRWVYAS